MYTTFSTPVSQPAQPRHEHQSNKPFFAANTSKLFASKTALNNLSSHGLSSHAAGDVFFAGQHPVPVGLKSVVKQLPYQREEADLFSDGNKLEASYYNPTRPQPPGEAKKPLVIVCSGFMGFAKVYPEMFARAFTPMGYPVFGFDYQGFGNSEGDVTQMSLDKEVRDIRASVQAVKKRAQTEGRPVVLMGWGMGGGLVLKAMDDEETAQAVNAVVCMNGFYNGMHVQQMVRSPKDFKRFLLEYYAKAKHPDAPKNFGTVKPFEAYPIPQGTTQDWVEKKLMPNVNDGDDFSRYVFGPDFVSSLAEFDVESEAHVPRMHGKPVLIIHGNNNDIHPKVEADHITRALRAHGVETREFTINGQHADFMEDDDPRYKEMIRQIDRFLGEHLNGIQTGFAAVG